MSRADELELLLDHMGMLYVLIEHAEEAKDWKRADEYMNTLLDIEDRYLTVEGRLSCD